MRVDAEMKLVDTRTTNEQIALTRTAGMIDPSCLSTGRAEVNDHANEGFLNDTLFFLFYS